MADDNPVELDENGNEVAAPAPAAETPTKVATGPTKPDGSKWDRFKNWYKTKKKQSVPLTILALIILLLLIPQTRYAVAGTVYKKDFAILVKDSATGTPVSGATVSSGGASAQTDGTGLAKIHVSVGSHSFSVSKNYYDSQTLKATVPLLSEKVTPTVLFHANGRQVKVTVTNIFNHQPLSNTDIKLANSDAKTDAAGTAIVVVPESTKQAKATLSLDGYNTAEATIQASDSEIKQNDLKLTPAGKIYFLSKLSGKIDVVKTDLDGKNRQTVLAGTGNEEDSNTVLLASRDWKYLALLSKRDSPDPKLYLLETETDKLTTIDQGKATFTPIGWDDSNFLYQVDRSSVRDWQAGQSSIKSFNAATKQLVQLDSTAGVGKNQYHFAHESYSYFGSGFYLVDHYLIYGKTWDYSSGDPSYLSGKNNTVQKISTGGAGHQILLSYGVDKYLESFLYKPRAIYYHEPIKNKYYVYQNGNLSQDQSIKTAYQKYQSDGVASTYLLSPDGAKTFWFESRDGKNTLLVGDVDGANGQSVGRTGDYVPYGWYTNDYLLASKDSSELFVIPKQGLTPTNKAYHVTDYHKPARSFYGYGGGYGGL